MADEKDKGVENAPGNAAESSEESTKSGGSKLIVWPVVVLLYAAVVFAASVFTNAVVVPKTSSWLVEQEVEQIAEDKIAEVERGGEFGEVYIIDDLVVNPARSGGTRYVAASIGLEAATPETLAELEKRSAQIKDYLIMVLGSKTVEELAEVHSRELLRSEIKTQVDEFLPDSKLNGVYFVNFVLQ